MPKLGLGTGIGRAIVHTPGVVTDGLVMKHLYPAGAVQLLSDGAAYFDSHPITGSYINCGASNSIITGTNVTYSCWVKLYDTDQARLMNAQKGSGSTNLGLRINDNSGSQSAGYINLLIYNGSGFNSIGYDGSLNDNKWHHIAATTTSSAQKLYINGAEVAEGSNGFANATSTNIFTLGSINGTGEFLGGYMANVGVWSRVLTQAEIKSIMFKQYADLTTSEKTSLVSFWNLDSTVKDGLSLVYDENNTTLGANLWDGGDVGPDSLGDADGNPSHSMDISNVGLAAGDVVKISGTVSGSNGGRIVCPDTGAGSNGVTLITGGGDSSHTEDGNIEVYVYVSDVTGNLKIRTDFDGSGNNQDDRTQKITNISVQKITNAGRLL